MSAAIYISHRRGDADPTADRLRKSIIQTFGDHAVFPGHTPIEPADKPPAKLQDSLAVASIAIAIIGPDWQASSDEGTQLEIETALSNGTPLLPVLVAGARLPANDNISESLARALKTLTLELRDSFWPHDIQLVLERIKSVLTHEQLINVKRGPYPLPPSGKSIPISKFQLEKALNCSLQGWEVTSSPLPEDPDVTRTELFREYEFRTFRDAVKFMYQLAPGCDIAIHHPRWENTFRRVRVYLSTWDIDHQISDRDIQLAQYFEKAYYDFYGY